MTQLVVRFYAGNEPIKISFIRLQRHVNADGELKTVFFDTQIPATADRADIQCLNIQSDKRVVLDDLRVEGFIGN